MTVGSIFEAVVKMATLPLRVPVSDGVKTTGKVQLEPAARVAGQLLVIEKSPVRRTLVKLKGVVPTFDKTRFCAVLDDPTICAPKVRLTGETTAAKPIPVPVRLTAWAGLEAEVVIDSVPVRDPVCVGVK